MRLGDPPPAQGSFRLLLQLTYLSKGGSLSGVEVGSLTWFSVPPLQYGWTLGESRNVIYREDSQEKRERIGDRRWAKGG